MSPVPLEFVDIHSHILPGIDDGSPDLATSIEMARIAYDDGIRVMIATPHQLGNFGVNTGAEIRNLVQQTQQRIREAGIDLTIMPGGDVRIEDGMVPGLLSGEVVSLADLRKHVLLELPHELYFPIDGVLNQLASRKMQGILSHPERNAGLLARPSIVRALVDAGCLMQVTAGSLVGTFGPASQKLAESLVSGGLVHFLATDAHSARSRRPLLRRAYERAVELIGEPLAQKICCEYPRSVTIGSQVPAGPLTVDPPKKTRRWFSFAGA